MSSLTGSAGFRSLRYFSTVLSSFRYSLETHPAGSDSRGCPARGGRFISLRTVTEKSLMPLNPVLPVGKYEE